MESYGGDAVVGEQGLDIVAVVAARLVADRDDVGDGQSPALHGDVERDVARLGDHGDAALHPLGAVGVRPQHAAVEQIEDPVAVGTDDGHAGGGLDEAALQGDALAPDLGEAGGIAHGRPRAAGGEVPHDGDGRHAGRRDESGIGSLGQIGDGAVGAMARDLRLVEVDGPDRAGITDTLALPDDDRRQPAADDGDMTRLEEAA